MNKNQFIAAMEQQLLCLRKSDRDDILNDYESHFVSGLEAGKTEEQVCAELGDPTELALTYIESMPDEVKRVPYIPPQDAEENAYSAPKYGAGAMSAPGGADSMPTTASPEKKNSDGVVTVVLLSVFVALPIALALIWAVCALIAGGVGCVGVGFGLTIAAYIGGVANAILSIGIALVCFALACLGVLMVLGGLALGIAIKKLVEWYIGVCKKMINGGNS